MKYFLFFMALFTSFSVFCESNEKPRHDPFWEGFNEGCIGRNVARDILYQKYDLELSMSSFAFAYLPDTGNGPDLLVRLDSGEMTQTNRPKTVFIAAADNEHTCITKTNFDLCPEAKKAYDLLTNLTIPVGKNFGSSCNRCITHYTEYILSVRSERGVENTWYDISGKSNLVKIIHQASDIISKCSKPSFEALEKLENKK